MCSSDLLSGSSYSVPLPVNPDRIYRAGMKTRPSGTTYNPCTDAHYQDEVDFWYFWNPENPGCELREGIDFTRVSVKVRRSSNTVQTFPEYSRLADENGVIRISVLFGMDDPEKGKNPDRSADINARNFVGFRRTLLRMGYRGRELSEDEIRGIAPAGTVVAHVEELVRELPRAKIVIRLFFGPSGIDEESTGFHHFLRDAMEKLRLNDSSFTYEPESSGALGFGFRCGFLGLLHMEIVQERLERDYNLNLLATVPSVEYEVVTTKGEVLRVDNPSGLPSPDRIDEVREPWMHIQIVSPKEYIGAIMDLVKRCRGEYIKMEYLDETRVLLQYSVPLAEILVDFFDQLKSRTQGYASLDYAMEGLRAGPLVRLDVLVNGEPVDALSLIIHRDKAYDHGRILVEKLRTLIPRHMFEVPIQAAVGARIIARETVRAMRKDVLSKCYGGDISRKRKLLEKQKEGKQRMKRVGSVEIPQEAFLAVLKLS